MPSEDWKDWDVGEPWYWKCGGPIVSAESIIADVMKSNRKSHEWDELVVLANKPHALEAKLQETLTNLESAKERYAFRCGEVEDFRSGKTTEDDYQYWNHPLSNVYLCANHIHYYARLLRDIKANTLQASMF